MEIKKVEIHNFRSISHATIIVHSMMILLGQNNHGKSNVLRALEFALTSSAKPDIDDFFAFRGEEDFLWVELTFADLSEQEKNTFQKYVSTDDTIRIRKKASILDGERIEVSYNGYISEPIDDFLRSENTMNLSVRENIQSTPLNDLIPSTGRLTRQIIEDAQRRYIDLHRDELTFRVALEASPFMGTKNIAAGLLPSFFLIPAVRDLDDEAKIKSSAFFGKLINFVIADMTAQDTTFRELKESLASIVRSLNVADDGTDNRPEQLQNLESSISRELTDWEVDVSVKITPPSVDTIFELGTDIHLDDGYKTLARQKGNGLQRAVIFALVRAWASMTQHPNNVETTSRRASESIIFAIEEPEIFLHPHAQRTLAKNLRRISENTNTQVFICSHSTHFLDLDHHKEIVIVKKNRETNTTTITQCVEEIFSGDEFPDRKRRFHIANWVNPDRGEMFFARKVVFVEGESEKSLLPFLAKKLNLLNENISIIDCGSKHNLPLYIALANAFRFNYIVIHDEDPIPANIGSLAADTQREKRNTFELNTIISSMIDVSIGQVKVISPDLEGCCGISRTSAKKGKALVALEHFHDEEAIPMNIENIVRNIYV